MKPVWLVWSGFGVIAFGLLLMWHGLQPTPSAVSLATASQITYLNLPTNDVVYDPFTDTIYASVPSSAGSIGDSIVPVNPNTGVIGTPVPIGGNPSKLAISDDGQYIYVGLDGESAVGRFHIPSQTPDLRFSLGAGYCGPRRAEDIEVVPGSPESVAVSLRGGCGHDGVAIYDSGVRREKMTWFGVGSNVIEFADTGDTLYGFDTDSSEAGFRRMAVDSSGVWVLDVSKRIPLGPDIEFENGLIYSTYGRVIDPVGPTLVGSYPAKGPRQPEAFQPDSSVGRTFYLTSTGFPDRILKVFDQDNFTLLASLTIPNVGLSSGLIRWGTDGLAFRTKLGQVVLVRSPLVNAPIPATPVPGPVSVNPNVLRLDIPTGDLAYDPLSQKIYASVPGRAGSFGNAILAIDPDTGTATGSAFVGSEPETLALSNDGQYLYAALEGAGSVSRVDISSLASDLQFSLGNHPSHGPLYVEDIEVLPGNPDAVAISRRNLGISPRHEGVAVYDGGVKRPVETPSHSGSNVIEFSEDASILYGHNNETSPGFTIYTMAVDASGVSITDSKSGLFWGFRHDIEFDDGLIYSTSGSVVDPVAGTLVGTFGASGPVEPDSACGTVFFVDSDGWIRAYDQSTFDLIGSIEIPGASGNPGSLIRWGTNGLAFRTDFDQLFILRSSGVVACFELDIKPGSFPNSINPESKGMIPVAILSNDDFDATTLDPDTVRFGPNGAESENRQVRVKDANHDSLPDLFMHFPTEDTGIMPGDTEACLTGETYDGVPIMGCDSVRTVPPPAEADGHGFGYAFEATVGAN